MGVETIAKIPPIKTGLDFLSSSHFKIGKEPKWLESDEAYQSTFKNDYPPKDVSKCGLSNIPPPAHIMHKDDRTNDNCSVTREQFVQKYQKEKSKACSSLTRTNFKMDKDERIETFKTTHDIYYSGITNSNITSTRKNFSQRMASHIPQGDREKENWPQSDYQNNFHSKELSLQSKTVNNPVFSGGPTIKGDDRSHKCNDMFNTTSRVMHPVYNIMKQHQVPYQVKYPLTRIPCGEETLFESTQQISFPKDLPPLSRSFKRDKALEELQKTTFRNGDNRLNNYKTTAEDSFTRFHLDYKQHLPSQTIGGGRTSSENVCFKERSFQQIGSTANMCDYKAPPIAYHSKKVDGSKLRTISKVTFGNDKRHHYDTTTDTCFTRKHADVAKPDVDTCHSSIPMKHYHNLVANSSYRTDFLKTNAKKLVPNPSAINNLVESHIGTPMKNFREFRTTNRETYTPKTSVFHENIDTGRLQKSSVPIGTLSY